VRDGSICVAEERSIEFESLYREHVDGVLAYALSRTTREAAIEVVESTFLVAWQRFAEIPESTRPWLIGVARRVLADQRRATGRREALGVRINATRAGDLFGVDPAEEVTDRASALDALGRLGDPDRELLCLIGWDGLTLDEAAQVLGCSRAALKVRLHRARRRFENALADEDARPPGSEHRSPTVHRLHLAPSHLAKETI
jgi:RNA polymerase sigma-70 factor, ECF subfamily